MILALAVVLALAAPVRAVPVQAPLSTSTAWLSGTAGVDEARSPRQAVEVATAEYQRTWSDLDRAAETLASELGPFLAHELPTYDRSTAATEARRIRSERLRANLAEIDARARRGGRLTAILFDDDREAVAWHGPGLLHEPAGWELPERGRVHRRSMTAVTLLSVREIATSGQPWQILVGLSYNLEPFPFADLEPLRRPRRGRVWRARWSIADRPESLADGSASAPDRGSLAVIPATPSAQGSTSGEAGPYLFLGFEKGFAHEARALGEGRQDGQDGGQEGERVYLPSPPIGPARWGLFALALAAVAFGLRGLFALGPPARAPANRPAAAASPEATGSTNGSMDGSTNGSTNGRTALRLSLLPALVFATGLAALAFGWAMAPPVVLAVFASSLAAGLALGWDSSAPAKPALRRKGSSWAGMLPAVCGWWLVGALAWAYQDRWGAVDLAGLGREVEGLSWLRWVAGAAMLAVAMGLRGQAVRGHDPSSGNPAVGNPAVGDPGSGEAAVGEAGSGEAAGGEAGFGEAAGGEAGSGEAEVFDRAQGQAETPEAIPGTSDFDRTAPAERWFLASVVLAALAGAAYDSPVPALVLGSIAAASLGRCRVSRQPGRSTPRDLGVAVLLAAMLGVVAWQIPARMVAKQELAQVYLPEMAPPTSEELHSILLELDQAVAELDLVRVLPPPVAAPSGLRDLAYVLWRRLPLSRRDGLSALVVERADGERSSFAFGLAVDDLGVPLAGEPRWPVPHSPAWRESLIEGEGLLWLDGDRWGSIRYWFLPRPGFRGTADETEELERNLVRGKPRKETADGLPPEALYGLFDLDGRALSSPWDEAPPLPREVFASEIHHGRLPTPEGAHWFWLDRGIDGLEALFLPVLGPRTASERVGFAVVGLLPSMLLLIGLGWLLGARQRGWRELVGTALRSYSRRLSLVYTVLLLLPLIALNLILLRSFTERLRQEQLSQAQNAMITARTLLVDYLQGLDPGFLIETQLDRELLEWVGGLVQHQVNLYWGSRLYASSQQELFTAGLLPHRIPGEIYDRLTLLGYDMSFRRQRAGDLAYLEIYAPFDVPGIVSAQQGLFLSVPLLEQEEEVERQATLLRRRALLITTVLFLVLLTVAGWLSRSFTRPIVQLIEGTRRIARGEPFGKLEPKEAELSALATAIGAMADQVDLGRRRLGSEKQFVERVVAHISSAVVSIDRRGRVALQNGLAVERLGARQGQSLRRALADDPSLAPIHAFVDEVRDSPQPRTRQVKLRPADGKVDVLEWSLTWVPIPGDEDPAALLIVDDATEVLRGQRLEAWAEMARIIAHEIKNPLTPIQLSTEHLRQVYRSNPERLDEVVERCTANVLSNVEELRSIASEFSIYSRIPSIELESGDLRAFVDELVANYEHARASDGSGTEIRCRLPAAEVHTRFDPKLLGRAVRNLLENALRAAGAGGRVVVEVDTDREDEPGTAPEGLPADRGWARIRVADSGPGVDPQKLERIFEPYFSTYETGTGLGLAITRRIVDEHGGAIEARNRPEGGLAVSITIPRISPGPDAPGGSEPLS